ncbi:MAG TPA: 2'-deoxycytidine 5'-triphosphate deaminase [Rhizomicrobium sp.]|nr:2'-deoxycytidine 5'-triphosphate deaminase [Rhizomicrobium sp.]
MNDLQCSVVELFAMGDDENGASAVYGDGTGVLPHQVLAEMMRRGEIFARAPFESDQLQPASIDLRLGRRAWRVRASFLPGKDDTVEERIAKLGGTEIDLKRDAVFESGVVYVVELLERTRLPNGLWGIANPKSSTGRLDVLARLITNGATRFDFVQRGYEGPLYVEIAPQAFSIVVREGIRLNQLRFVRGTSPGVPLGTIGGLADLYKTGQLVKPDGALLPMRGSLVPVSIDLRGSGPHSIVGYKAKKTTDTIDMGRTNYYDPREFWEKIQDVDGRLPLDEGEFYILATREEVGIPPDLAAEMVPFDSSSGEFRVHYAGFFDPGFGYQDGRAQGSKAVLEVRSYGVSFMLEHGQIVGWLNFSRLAGGAPSKLYGGQIQSNYQGQGVKLAKHFKPWPTD